MRMLVVTAGVTALSALVISNAYFKKQQFYPTMVYLLNSNRSLGVLYLQAFVFVWMVCVGLKKLFFGTLRAAEVEHLIESLWYAILETFILLAAFHHELSVGFVTTVMSLFIVKSFHWLAADRIDYMERSPLIGWVFHMRAVFLLLFLFGVDVFFMRQSWNSLMSRGPSVEIVFGLEYAIMLLSAFNTLTRYILHTIDLQSENPWENKTIYMRYVDIVLGFFKLMLFVSYMAFMLYVLFIPLHIARRVYMTAKHFQKSITDVISSHQAIRNLNTLYPDATAEELNSVNNVCIICREEMVSQCKKLPCNHIFHTHCLHSWFQRQQSCPTCRMDVLNQTVITRLQGRRQQQQNQQQRQQQPQGNGGPPQMPPPGQGLPPHGMFPPHMMPPMWPGMMPPPRNIPPQPQPQQQQQQQPNEQAADDQSATPPAPPTSQQQQPSPPQPGSDEPDSRDQEERVGGDGQSSTNLPPPPPLVGTAAADNISQQDDAAPTLTMPGIPHMPPPFPFMPPMMNFMTPPFVGMPNEACMQSLSDDQLKALEGMERANVEARIALLRNVQRLLDSAVTQLNQYSTVMATLGPVGPGFPGAPPPPSFTIGPSNTATGDANASATTDPPNTTASSQQPTTTTSSSSRTGLFQSQGSFSGATRPLLEPRLSYTFSAQSLSASTSVEEEQPSQDQTTEEGEKEEREGDTLNEAHPDGGATSQDSSSSSPAQSIDSGHVDSEIRQRRLQRFHSLPATQEQSALSEIPSKERGSKEEGDQDRTGSSAETEV